MIYSKICSPSKRETIYKKINKNISLALQMMKVSPKRVSEMEHSVRKRSSTSRTEREREGENAAASAGDTHIYIIYTLDINDIL